MPNSETPWTTACEAPLFMEFSRQDGVGCHSHLQGNLPDPGIEPKSEFQADYHLSQWERIEPEINSNSCLKGQIIFDKGAKTSMEKGQCFQQMVLGKVDTYLQKNEVRPYTLIP